jgi:pilus assembly protein CpaB
MNRIRLLLMLVIALTAGGALAFATYAFVQTPQAETVAAPTTPVVVAATDLSLGEMLTADDLRVVQWPQDVVPEGVFSSTDDLVGRGLLAALVRNEPVLADKVAPRESGAGLPPVIPPGKRAVSVRVNEVIGVAGYVLPGTRVDVLATASPTNEREDTTSKLVLANVQVLAAGTRLEQDGDKAEPMQVTVVTLLVTPEEAEKLTLASTEGKIQLALRNPLDPSAPETPGIRPAVLLGSASRPAPAPRPVAAARPQAAPQPPPPPAPEPPATVEVIRGDKRANETIR